MSFPFESTVVYSLGFVGFVAVGLLPYRSWLLMIDMVKCKISPVRKRWLFVVAILTSATALLIDIQVSARVFTCLTEVYCGPGIASGWGYLAILGVVYIAFEAVSYLVRIGCAK